MGDVSTSTRVYSRPVWRSSVIGGPGSAMPPPAAARHHAGQLSKAATLPFSPCSGPSHGQLKETISYLLSQTPEDMKCCSTSEHDRS